MPKGAASHLANSLFASHQSLSIPKSTLTVSVGKRPDVFKGLNFIRDSCTVGASEHLTFWGKSANFIRARNRLTSPRLIFGVLLSFNHTIRPWLIMAHFRPSLLTERNPGCFSEVAVVVTVMWNASFWRSLIPTGASEKGKKIVVRSKWLCFFQKEFYSPYSVKTSTELRLYSV